MSNYFKWLGKAIKPSTELKLGWIIGIGLGIVLALRISPLYFFLTIPTGFLLSLHGYYREFGNGSK